MGNILQFISPVPPSVNHYNSHRVVAVGKGKFRKHIVSSYPSKDYVDFKKLFEPYLNEIVQKHKWEMIKGRNRHYFLDVVMYFDRKGKDGQNYFKCPCDVGNQILWEDDTILVTRINRIYYTSSDEVEPHFEYILYPVDYFGIFDNEEQYVDFIDKCATCRWYREGNCSRLKDFMSYKITNDIDWQTKQCKKYKKKAQ